MFHEHVIVTRIQRVQMYMGDAELCSVVTNGVSQKPVSQVVNPEEVHTGLEEGVWSYHLLRYLTDKTKAPDAKAGMLTKYISAIQALATKPSSFFVWEVDNANNSWAPVWVRLFDRLKHYAETKPEFADLPSDLQARIVEVYAHFKAGALGVDARREKHTAIDSEFLQLFNDPRYTELQAIIRQPVTKEVTVKHCGKFLLEIKDPEERKRYITLYFEALGKNRSVPLAAKLVDHIDADVRTFSKEYQGPLPTDLCDMVAKHVMAFKQ